MILIVFFSDEESGSFFGSLQTQREKQLEKAERIRNIKGLPDIGSVVDAV